jgi:hypothetical protein
MTESDPSILFVMGPVLFVLVLGLFWFFNSTITRRWNRHRAETVSKWEAEGVQFLRDPIGGQFGGLESMGVNRVVRGIGFVALTGHDLRVTRAAPSATWCIPFRQIKSVTLRSAFLGKRGDKIPFIVVRFVKDGQADKLGFQVKDFETWAGDLAQAAGVSLKDQRKD